VLLYITFAEYNEKTSVNFIRLPVNHFINAIKLIFHCNMYNKSYSIINNKKFIKFVYGVTWIDLFKDLVTNVIVYMCILHTWL